MAPDVHGKRGLIAELAGPTSSPTSLGAPRRVDEEARLAEILEVILAVAGSDFSHRAPVGTGDHILDGISAGLNMLIEELGRRTKSEAEVRARLLQAERLAAIGTLAAGVAHEINNPASFLLGNFIVLSDHMATLRGRINPENQAILDEVTEIARVGQAGVERIATIVRGLRNFSRIEDHEVSEVRLDEIAEQACVLASREITTRARLVKNLQPVRPMLGERTKLTQVITNLLLNAAQSIEGPMSANEVELSVTEANDHIYVRVRDTGRGIPLDQQGKIFEPFYTTKSFGQGTGLGLSVSADIARQHFGILRFESQPKLGTTFVLELPLANGLVAPAPPPPPPPPSAPKVETTKPRVLFIDDEEQLLRTYKRMLKTCDVVLAAGGQAGIDAISNGPGFDVVFCDISMPEVDGVDVWTWIEKNAPDVKKRVLFCTGGAFTARGATFVEAHQHRIVDKPVGRAQLEAAVERLVLECGRALASASRGPDDRNDR